MLYLTMKHLHVACVVLSITGFCLRGFLLAQKSALAGRRLFRVLPHINDSLLLAAAISLTVLTGQYPFVDTWLTVKIFGLIGYIILGSLALKAGRSAGLRVAAGVAALLVFGWIASVALTRNPWGLLA